MSKYYNIDYADQDLTFIIQKNGYGRYVEDLEKRIDKAIESLNYYIEGMNKSLEIWNKVKENEKIDDKLLQMLEREKQNYIDLLDILKGEENDNSSNNI